MTKGTGVQRVFVVKGDVYILVDKVDTVVVAHTPEEARGRFLADYGSPSDLTYAIIKQEVVQPVGDDELYLFDSNYLHYDGTMHPPQLLVEGWLTDGTIALDAELCAIEPGPENGKVLSSTSFFEELGQVEYSPEPLEPVGEIIKEHHGSPKSYCRKYTTPDHELYIGLEYALQLERIGVSMHKTAPSIGSEHRAARGALDRYGVALVKDGSLVGFVMARNPFRVFGG